MNQDEITRWRDAVFITQSIISNKGGTGYIEALNLDALSNPPPEHLPKPVAYFYIRFLDEEKGDYYRAIYLNERTVRNLIIKIAEKREVDPDRFIRIVRVNRSGLKTMVDDDVVQQVPEGQDMLAEVIEVCRSQYSTTSIGTPPMAALEVRLTY